MLGDPVEISPLFPLVMVALPGEIVPLHIFEPRYRTMIGECLEQGTGFTIIRTVEDAVETVGCSMRVTEVLERFDDGRLNIITRGVAPVRIVEERHGSPYHAALVTVLEDDDEVPDPEMRSAAQDAYARLVLEASEREIDPVELSLMSSYDMAATVELSPDLKQRLLELRSENGRLNLLARVLRAALKRLDYIEVAEVRASSNGVVRFG
ncbi:unannotated protein [freshwater metagenome]|uniref:Unannotated protein n=1 Tax=freshwater metagenome TaxID=449393 RepID=A0A6J7DQ90_9ZZZZ|nr:peptidase S16 [Actinomycetota bacterium]